MGKQVAFLVAAVGLLGMIAGGALVYVYFQMQPPEVPSASMAPRPTAATQPPAPPPKPLMTVDPRLLIVEGFALGMKEAEVLAVGDKLKMKFVKEPAGSAFMMSYVPPRDARFRSVRLMLTGGEVVGVRVKYAFEDTERANQWQEILGEPYRFDPSGDKHWETTDFKAKAMRSGAKFYVVRKPFRDLFEW